MGSTTCRSKKVLVQTAASVVGKRQFEDVGVGFQDEREGTVKKKKRRRNFSWEQNHLSFFCLSKKKQNKQKNKAR